MDERRPRLYDQFCPVAAALDAIGDRWTLLIVRDLLAGPLGFNDLLRSLPGLGTGLLTARPREMAARGLIERTAPGGSRAAHRLTASGRELDGAMLALARWGTPRLADLGPRAVRRPLWLLQALAAAVRPPGDPDFALDVAVDVTGPPPGRERHPLLAHRGRLVARRGARPLPDAAIHTDADTLEALVTHRTTVAQAIADGRIRASGLANAAVCGILDPAAPGG